MELYESIKQYQKGKLFENDVEEQFENSSKEDIITAIDKLEEDFNNDPSFSIIESFLNFSYMIKYEDLLQRIGSLIHDSEYFDEPINGSVLITCIETNDHNQLELLSKYIFRNASNFDPCPIFHCTTNDYLSSLKILHNNGIITENVEDEFYNAITSGSLSVVQYYCDDFPRRLRDYDDTDKKWIKLTIQKGSNDIIDFLNR